MIMNCILQISCILPLVTLTSCATMMHGTTQKIGIASNPSQANVWIDHAYAGTTPLEAKLKRNKGHTLCIELEGYQPYELILTRQMSSWVFGNAVFGGLPGLIIDAVSGGIYRLTPEQVQAELCSGNIHKQQCDAVNLAITLHPKKNWVKIGQLEKMEA